MFQTILQALVPVVFVAGLGWLVGRLGVLDPQRIRSITTFIVTVALPAALFVGVFSFSPSQLENARYLLTLAVALMGTWAVGFALARIAFRRTTPSAGMLAMNASFPDLAYFGLPVLTAVIGSQGLLPIIVGNLVVSVLMVPITIVLLGEMDGTKHESLYDSKIRRYFRARYEGRTDCRTPASFAVALSWGIGSISLNALVDQQLCRSR